MIIVREDNVYGRLTMAYYKIRNREFNINAGRKLIPSDRIWRNMNNNLCQVPPRYTKNQERLVYPRFIED